MHNFLYSLTICLLHYYPRHVSSINMLMFRRKNCIHAASGIFVLCKRLPSTLVESGLCLLHYYPRHVSSINMCILRRKNCIHAASGIVALCKCLPSTLVESGLCYIIILDMFRALTCPSSGGKIVFTQHLVSLLSVNVCPVLWLRADSVTLLSSTCFEN